jgi:hypothetical protein
MAETDPAPDPNVAFNEAITLARLARQESEAAAMHAYQGAVQAARVACEVLIAEGAALYAQAVATAKAALQE